MRRTSIEIDESLLSQVQEALGTKGVRDTVEKAFQQVLRAHLRARLGERIRTGDGIDLGDEILNASRRWSC